MLKDNARATLKVTKYDEKEDDIDTTLDLIVKVIKADVGQVEDEKQSYKREISNSILLLPNLFLAHPSCYFRCFPIPLMQTH